MPRTREAIGGSDPCWRCWLLALRTGEGLSKKALKTRVLHMPGGARASTLKKKLLDWKSARAWFQIVTGLSWPARLEDVVELKRALRQNLSDDLLVGLQLHGEIGTSSRRFVLLVH